MMAANRDNLVERLRGIYTVPVDDGAGLLDGKDTFTRSFSVPPIQGQAADEIELVRTQRDAWRAACRFLYEVIGEDGPRGCPVDLISFGDLGRVIALIGKAESLEDHT